MADVHRALAEDFKSQHGRESDDVPQLKMKLTCNPPQLILGKPWLLTRTVTYEEAPTARSIVIHPYPILGGFDNDPESLHQCRDEKWEEVEARDSGESCFMLWDDDPVRYAVGTTPFYFTCLKPGDTWTKVTRYYSQDETHHFPEEVKVGDKFQWRYAGAEIDWWDWGAMEDHQETKVMHMNGEVTSGNGGRPKLVVSAATMEFEVGGDKRLAAAADDTKDVRE
ncbi:hypothetical protein BDV96DRAFT_26175 [Lophiotrema nucula]|uniref:Uncharacterized protein n=1 Tax=Lophiotrema nucula TaxID=690887 RepID=A0A6A5ZFD4_9PLEO|nr:hypothetical protein BDV96DRAFT_26175 [Lophiotrema nucula]